MCYRLCVLLLLSKFMKFDTNYLMSMKELIKFSQ